jgi:hypothetical protein
MDVSTLERAEGSRSADGSVLGQCVTWVATREFRTLIGDVLYRNDLRDINIDPQNLEELGIDTVLQLRDRYPTTWMVTIAIDGRVKDRPERHTQTTATQLKEQLTRFYEGFGPPVSLKAANNLFYTLGFSVATDGTKQISAVEFADLIVAFSRQNLGQMELETAAKKIEQFGGRDEIAKALGNGEKVQAFSKAFSRIYTSYRNGFTLPADQDRFRDFVKAQKERRRVGVPPPEPTRTSTFDSDRHWREIEEKRKRFDDSAERLFRSLERRPELFTVLKFFEAKRQDWNAKSIDIPRFETTGVLVGDIKDILHWIVDTPDFDGTQELFDEFRSILTPSGATNPVLFQAFHEFEDEAVSCGFGREVQGRSLEKIIEYWDDRRGLDNKPYIKNARQMVRRHPYRRVARDRVVYYIPGDSVDSGMVDYLGKRDAKLRNVLGREGTERVHVLFTPSVEYCSRAAASHGKMTVLAAGGESMPFTYTHERIHLELEQLFGDCRSGTIAEGAATYISRLVDSGDFHNDWVGYEIGIEEILHADEHNSQIGLSHTQMLELLGYEGRLGAQEKYDFAYKFGGYLMAYIHRTYGKTALLEFYEAACSPEMRKFNRNGGERLIVQACLEKVISKYPGKKRTVVELQADFEKYVKETQRKASRPKKHWFW